MPLSKTTFDTQTLSVLESVLDDICRDLASGVTATEAERRADSREHLAKLLIKYAQDGESDPVVLRKLVLKEFGKK
jgi:hypothetical protein